MVKIKENSTQPPVARLGQRLRWAARFRELVGECERELTGLIEREIGKPRWEAVTADIAPLLASLRWHEKHAAGLLRSRRVGGGGLLALGQRHRIERHPLGHVAIIATWNYPVGLLGVQLAQAVLAGNRVTVKPSELACETQGFLLDLAANAARDVGLPEELLRRTEATRDAGRDLLAGGGIDHVVFTGSTGVGRAIAEALAPRLVTSTLELSGRDSAFVLRDADLKLAAKTIWWAVTTNAGQTCMAPRRALVHTSVYQAFLRELGLFAGGAVRRSLVSESAAADVVRLAEEAAACGARSLSGVLEPRRGRAVVPVAMVDCPPDASLVEGDHFGPAIAVVPCDSEAAMLAIHNRCDQHLATSVFSKRPAAALDRLAPYLHVRTVTANNCIIPTAHPGVSIAGSGESGWGASQGRDGLLALTAGVNVSTTSPVFRPPLDAPHPSRVDGMARMFVRLLGGVRHRAKAPEVIRVGPAVGTAAGTAEDSGSQAASEAAPVATAGGQRRVETKIKHTSAETTQPAGASE